MKTMTASTVALRSAAAFSSSGVEVDEANGIIRNCAVMTVGPASGREWEIDRTTIEQLKALIDAQPEGVPMRFRHPELDGETQTFSETLGTDVGRLKNARIVGDTLRGDVHLGEYAKVLPALGDVWTYLITKAKSDPSGMGLSAVIGFDLETLNGSDGVPEKLVARIGACIAVDFVGKPAANPNGLLSAKETGGVSFVTTVGNRTMMWSAPTVEQCVALRDAMTSKASASGPAHLFGRLAAAHATGDDKEICRSLGMLRNAGIRIQFPRTK